MRSTNRSTVAAAIAAICIACSSRGGKQGTPADGTPPPFDESPPPSSEVPASALTPNPLTVTVAVDPAFAVTETVPEAGGSVQATGPDGSRFTLTIPSGALASDEQITMTPVVSIDGLPLSGGLVAAVQLEPSGLWLLRDAVLAIEPSASVDPASIVGFAWEGTGEEFHLEPIEPGTAVTVHVRHFSGAGIGSGSAADTAAMGEHPPTAPADQFAQAVANEARQAPQGVVDDAGSARIEAAAREQWRVAVHPRVLAAEADDSRLALAAHTLIEWNRAIDLLSITAKFTSELTQSYTSLGRGVRYAVDRAAERCVSRSDPTEGATLLRLAKWCGLLEGSYGFAPGYTPEALLEKAMRCLSFELRLRFGSQWAAVSTDYAESYVLSAVVPLPTDPVATAYTGAGPVTLTSFTDTPNTLMNCSCATHRLSEPVELRVIASKLRVTDDAVVIPAEFAATLHFVPDSFTIEHDLDADGAPCYWPSVPLWDWHTLHASEASLTDGAFVYAISGWEAQNTPVIASKAYSRSVPAPGEGTMVEDTVLELVHAPRP